jgi:hypothetical protein
MNNQEIISRAISYNNSEINAVKSYTNVLSKNLQEKEGKIIELNTDALEGLVLPGNVSYPEFDTNILLNLFGFDNVLALYNAIPTFDNKIFVLKPTLEPFSIGSTSYIITNCTPCIGKVIPYGTVKILMLTFVFNTVNSQMGIITLYVDGISSNSVRGRIGLEEIPDGLPTKFSYIENNYVKKDELNAALETVQQMIKDATNRIDGGIINSNNTPTVSGIGEITESNDILINEEMLSTGTYTLKYLDGDDNVVNNSKPITNFTI